MSSFLKIIFKLCRQRDMELSPDKLKVIMLLNLFISNFFSIFVSHINYRNTKKKVKGVTRRLTPMSKLMTIAQERR